MGERVAIVTACGSGMGAAAARRLVQDGFKISVPSSSGIRVDDGLTRAV